MRLSGNEECFDLHQSLTWEETSLQVHFKRERTDKKSDFWWGKSTKSTVAPVIQTKKEKSQRMEIRKIKQVLKKKSLRRDITLGSLMKTCDFLEAF